MLGVSRQKGPPVSSASSSGPPAPGVGRMGVTSPGGLGPSPSGVPPAAAGGEVRAERWAGGF